MFTSSSARRRKAARASELERCPALSMMTYPHREASLGTSHTVTCPPSACDRTGTGRHRRRSTDHRDGRESRRSLESRLSSPARADATTRTCQHRPSHLRAFRGREHRPPRNQKAGHSSLAAPLTAVWLFGHASWDAASRGRAAVARVRSALSSRPSFSISRRPRPSARWCRGGAQ